MTDLNWCTYCDNAISRTSNSLYCSEKCLRSDALHHHPLLGYEFSEFKHFPKVVNSSPVLSVISSTCSSDDTSSNNSKIQHQQSNGTTLPVPFNHNVLLYKSSLQQPTTQTTSSTARNSFSPPFFQLGSCTIDQTSDSTNSNNNSRKST